MLLVCRDATAQYAWSAHFNLAREAGLSGETIEAIRALRRPEFGRDDERIVYDLVTELLASKKVSPATYGRAEAALGRDGIIEAVTCAGFYGMIGLVLNTRDTAAARRRCLDLIGLSFESGLTFALRTRRRDFAPAAKAQHRGRSTSPRARPRLRAAPDLQSRRPPKPKAAGNWCAKRPWFRHSCAADQPPRRGTES